MSEVHGSTHGGVAVRDFVQAMCATRLQGDGTSKIDGVMAVEEK